MFWVSSADRHPWLRCTKTSMLFGVRSLSCFTALIQRERKLARVSAGGGLDGAIAWASAHNAVE
jgi:hypothetical protein